MAYSKRFRARAAHELLMFVNQPFSRHIALGDIGRLGPKGVFDNNQGLSLSEFDIKFRTKTAGLATLQWQSSGKRGVKVAAKLPGVVLAGSGIPLQNAGALMSYGRSGNFYFRTSDSRTRSMQMTKSLWGALYELYKKQQLLPGDKIVTGIVRASEAALLTSESPKTDIAVDAKALGLDDALLQGSARIQCTAGLLATSLTQISKGVGDPALFIELAEFKLTRSFSPGNGRLETTIPRGGFGDWLRHLFGLGLADTARGESLKEWPLSKGMLELANPWLEDTELLEALVQPVVEHRSERAGAERRTASKQRSKRLPAQLPQALGFATGREAAIPEEANLKPRRKAKKKPLKR